MGVTRLVNSDLVTVNVVATFSFDDVWRVGGETGSRRPSGVL